MDTLAEKVFNFILEDKEAHLSVLRDISPDKRAAVVGRRGKLIVTGPQGGQFIIRLTPVGLFRDDEGEGSIRNEILMSDETLMNILIWIVGDPGDRGLNPRNAYAERLIRITGDRVLYDAQEILDAVEKHAFEKMRPIARAALEGLKGEKGGR